MPHAIRLCERQGEVRQLPAFFEQMVTIKRVMEENGWKLAGAWSTALAAIADREVLSLVSKTPYSP